MLKLFNTASKKIEEFKPIEENRVKIYSCGMTVYSNPHIGHIKAYLMSDVLVRTLRLLGYDVTQVMNVTDVGHNLGDEDDADDKIETKALKENTTPWHIARIYEKLFFEELNKVNISRPNIIARATEHIPEMIHLIEKLEENGFVYRTKVGLIYDTSKFKDYSKFANLDLDSQNAGARVEVDDERKAPWDFALWLLNKPNHIMKWNSPWGIGYPGWHIECSAMAMKYLGEQIDIHTGGIDHIKIHHTNEIAQSEGATGKKFVNYWLHAGHLLVDNTKMSKSLGNGYTIEYLQKNGYSPLSYRFMLLKSDYKKPFNFTWENLYNAQNELVKIWRYVAKLPHIGGEVLDEYKQKFVSALENDLNTALSISVVWELINSKEKPEDKLSTLKYFDLVLGLNLENSAYELNLLEDLQGIDHLAKQKAELLLEERKKAKIAKNFVKADEIRAEIEKMGFVVDDTAVGSTIRLTSFGKLL